MNRKENRAAEAPSAQKATVSFRNQTYAVNDALLLAMNERRRKNARDALEICNLILDQAPDFSEVYHIRALALRDMGRHAEALADCKKTSALKPGNVYAYVTQGEILQKLERHAEAAASYEKAIALKPDYAEAYFNRGVALQAMERDEEALASYAQAIALKPDYAGAYIRRGELLCKTKRYAEAMADIEKVLTLDMPNVLGELIYTRMHFCRWQDWDRLMDGLGRGVDAGRQAAVPFVSVIALPSPARQKKCAEIYVRNQWPPLPPLWKGERYSHDKIRLGYFSSDFRNHATAYLMAELFERYDRSKFEVAAFSFGPPSEHPMRCRMEKAFDRFIDVHNQSDREIAMLARSMEIDIAVDLKGFILDARPGIFALRPAPVQVNYLGYPGTMGAPYMDYIIADPIVIPEDHKPYYTEKVIYLADCYQANDSSKIISDKVFTRREWGLPENGFVFCSFNSNYKITPQVFDIWMRLLHKVEGSVLWLYVNNQTAAVNLRDEAAARGIAGHRLVFTGQVEMPDHLARHRLADLFLDTFPCNAHTTASDALWAGLPLLTCAGETFAGRVAASLLNAMGLPELVARSEAEYEALALELAAHPQKLQDLRRKLAENRLTSPLFDTKRFTSNIESVYAAFLDVLNMMSAKSFK